MRAAVVEGRFYSGEKKVLEKQISGFISGVKDKKDIYPFAGIVPHAGYTFSGKCAASFYKLLVEKKYDSVIVIGTNHSGLGSKIALSAEDFESTFEVSENDLESVEKILGNKGDIGVSEIAHKYEHSIEVQLPFIKFVVPNAKIVPILARDLSYAEVKSISGILLKIVEEKEKQGEKVLVLASSDFNHYGKAYGFVPFTDHVKENLSKLDNSIIDEILSLDTKGFMEVSRGTSVCGKDAIALVVEMARMRKLKAEKLSYYSSGEISGDWDAAVGYASIAFY